VDVPDSSDYQKPKPIAGEMPKEALDESGTPVSGHIMASYIITVTGEVLEPRILMSTEERANTTALAALKKWRFEPARLGEKPISTFAAQEFKFQSPKESTYQNPIDRKSYTADWKTYQPNSPAKQSDDHIQAGPVRLLAEQSVYEENITTDELVAVIKETEKLLHSAGPGKDENFNLMLQITLSADVKPKVEFATKGQASKETLEAIHDTLKKLSDIRSKKDAIAFQLQYTFGKGSGE
jgi:hypothetical protein